MERITSEELRAWATIALRCDKPLLAETLLKAAYTIDEMDKDIAILESEAENDFIL